MKTQLLVMGWVNVVVWGLAILTVLAEDSGIYMLVGCAYIVWTGITMIQASKLIVK